ncbi:MAG: HD domain-containing protein [Clostridia bacterium]|nr:HD domain-containing protein [Clostridia bacterium]
MSDLTALQTAVAERMSPYRFTHTLGVADMAARLAALYCPDEGEMLRAAALLHDITKELDDEAQLALLQRAGIALRADERSSPKIYHGITAPLVIVRDFPDFATDALLSAVRWHTTGRAGMTLTEAILYLADYIEEGRTFPDCVALRERFFAVHPEKMTRTARLLHLAEVVRISLEMTVADLTAAGAPVCADTLAALSWLKAEQNPF